jgi:hypothetical protein
MAFAIGPVFAITSWVFGRRSLPHREETGSTTLPDVIGSLLLVVSMTALSTGIVEGRTWRWSDPRILAAFVVAAAVLPVFVWRSGHHHSPVIALSLLKVRSFTRANLAALLFGMSTGGIMLVNTFFLRNVWGYSLLETGFGLIPAHWWPSLWPRSWADSATASDRAPLRCRAPCSSPRGCSSTEGSWVPTPRSGPTGCPAACSRVLASPRRSR